MLLFIAVLLGLLVGALRKGKILRLCMLKGLWLPILAFLYVPAMKLFPEISFPLKVAITTLSYLCVFVFVIMNRKYVVSSIFLGLGGLSNFLVIAVNNFRMPISARALTVYEGITAEAVMAQRPDYFIATDGARLLLLGDVIYIPIPIIKGFLSVGDILLSVGMFLLIVTVSGDKSIETKNKMETNS